MRRLIALSALICLIPLAASAETFTFTSRTEIVNRIVAPVAGAKTIVAQFSTGEIDATYPSRRAKSQVRCATWPAPPGGMFTANGACVASEEDGAQFTVVVACRAVDEKSTVSDCFGQLTGTAGVYEGKTGTVSWRSTVSGDAKVSTAAGNGQWN
jgi:hypothetical protein